MLTCAMRRRQGVPPAMGTTPGMVGRCVVWGGGGLGKLSEAGGPQVTGGAGAGLATVAGETRRDFT